MDPRWQAFFFAAAILVWFFAVFVSDRGRVRLTDVQLMCLGWLLFAIPFTHNAAVAGW